MNQKIEEDNTSDSDSQKETVSSKVRLERKNNRSDATNMAVLANTKLRAKTRRPIGRLGKRKTRKNARIKGLDAIDFLHNETLLSTASKGVGPKSPPPPGCVDYQFTTLTAMAADTVPIHTELPPATYDTPYALQVLLDMYREQFLAMVRCMKSDDFRKNVEIQIIEEKEKKQKLTEKLEQLEKQINQLISDSLKLLRTRMAELGITNGYNAKELMAKAKEIMSHHHELQGEAVQLNNQIPVLEGENAQLLTDSIDEKCEEPLKFEEHLSPGRSDDDGLASIEIPIQQVKSEPLEDDQDKVSPSELQCQLNAVDCVVRTQTVRPSERHLRITPFSIVLPRIGDVARSNLLTPAQKKFACNDSQIINHIQDPPIDTFSLNNENKPPVEKHESTHRHRHKKSHKSKRKHKHHGTLDQHELKVAKPTKTESFATPSYSRMITDPIEDIITRTLNDNSKSPYIHRESSAIVSPAVNHLNCGVTNGGGSDKMDQSDYRRVPPMKIALKKFVQENNYLQSSHSHSPSVMRTTVGDLVSSEIEKSLEISNRSTVNQASEPSDYNTVNHRSMSKRPSCERRETRGSESHQQPGTKSPFLTPTHVVPPPSYPLCKTSPKIREEPFEGLAASMFGTISSCRSSEADSSRHSSPYCTPPMNLEFKMSEPSNTVPVPEYVCSSFNTVPRLPSDPNSLTDQRSQTDGNRWKDVSMHFDRMFEFVTNKIVSQENVPSKDKFRSKLRDSITDTQSPTFALNPPPLFRADSSFADSPPMPDLPVSPASLEGPFSPVPSLSPPALSSPVSTSNTEGRDERSTFSEKFRPKGKGWKWP